MSENTERSERPRVAALDVLTSPWAIEPEALRTICGIYDRHLRGEIADLGAIEAKLGRPLHNEPQGYTVDRGVAIVPVTGVLSKRANLFTRTSGGVSTQLLQRDLEAALVDQAVKAILLVIDSPGGTVDGTQALATFVREGARKKPMAAIADGRMASAAYWIGSAVGAGNLFIADDTTVVGSIGVVAAHVDRSEAERQAGVKVTEITSGAYKRIASEHAPLSPEGRASIQELTDHIYTVFVNEVAANRGTGVDTVLADMAAGRVFLGQKAIAAGLVDGVSSVPALVTLLGQRAAGTVGVSAPARARLDPEKIAAQARAFQESEAAAGRVIDTTTAVQHVAHAAGGDWGPAATPTPGRLETTGAPGARPTTAAATAATAAAQPRTTPPAGATDDPEAIARQAQELVDAEARAGRSCSATEAVRRLTEPQTDPAAVGRRLQDYQSEQAALGRHITLADAAGELGFTR